MDLLKTNINKLYFKYLFSAFGKRHNMFDIQYGRHGVRWTIGWRKRHGGALMRNAAVVVIISIGILFGIGGAVAHGCSAWKRRQNPCRYVLYCHPICWNNRNRSADGGAGAMDRAADRIFWRGRDHIALCRGLRKVHRCCDSSIFDGAAANRFH